MNKQLLLSILGCLAVGLLSSLLSGSDVAAIYATLNKPFFAPPDYIFGPVWSVLYVMMGVSLYLVWREKEDKDAVSALRLFFVQLLLNFLWSIIFFGAQDFGLAFYEIVLLLITVVMTIISFKKISRAAAYLLIPYALWVAFATLLTYSIWTLA